MARQVKVLVTCDICSDPVDEGATDTVHSFGFGGKNYEIDLCAKHGSEFVNAMADWVTAGTLVPGSTRKSGGGAKPAASTTAATTPSRRKAELDAVRAWARENGYNVGDRGRISAEIYAAYANATGEDASPAPKAEDAPDVTAPPPGVPDMWDEEDAQPGAVRNPDGSLAGS